MKTEKEKMLNGEEYNSMDKELETDMLNVRELLYDFNLTKYSEMHSRRELLKKILRTSMDDVYIEPPFYCDYGYNIKVGKNFNANFGLTILDSNEIIFGDDILIGPHTQIITSTRDTDPIKRKSFNESAKKIHIGSNVWIGGGVIILAGVTIGDNSVIGAGSVVTKNVPENCVAAGNPCKVIKNI
jgi:maltose O-acetyltransferase